MIDRPRLHSPEDDLAFMRSIVEGGGRPPMTMAICYLAGGLLYGLQCLFHVGQILGVIRWPGLVELGFLIAITGAFLVVLAWSIQKDRKDAQMGNRGPMASRAMSAALSGAGMANAAVIIVFLVGAIRDQDFAIWLYYPAVIFCLQSAAWYMAWNLKKKGWMLATAIGQWATAVALGLSVREPVLYLGICTAALFLLFAGPGWILYRDAKRA